MAHDQMTHGVVFLHRDGTTRRDVSEFDKYGAQQKAKSLRRFKKGVRVVPIAQLVGLKTILED